MDPDLGFCPLITDAAMALLSIATSGSQPPPSSVTTEGEESHHPPASSTRPRTGSTGGGDELRSRPESSSAAAAVRETRELEEEAPRREATAAAGRGGRPPCSGSPHDGESEAGRARGDGHGWSSRGSLGARRARSRPRRPPTGAGMGRRSLGETPGGAAVTAGIDRGEASATAGIDRGEASAAVTAGMDRGEASATAAIDRGEASATAGIERGEASGTAGIDHGEASAAVTAAIDRGEASATAGIDRGKAPATVTLEPVSDEDEYSQYVLCVIESLKMKVTADRLAYIKKRIEENGSKLSTITRKTCYASKVWQRNIPKDTDLVSNLLTSRLDDVNSLGVLLAEEDVVSYEEQTSNATSTSMLGGLAATNAIGPIKLPKVLKHPRYTTWTFVHRNQRMAEDQNDYEAVEDEEEKNGFKGVEDYIIRMTIQECRMTDAVLEILAQCFDRAAGDIKARYEILDGEKTKDSSKGICKLNAKVEDVYRDKDLDAALDSFDNLFCRRCLIFDCRLHGCSQDSVFPTEKQSPWNSMVDDGISCGIHCYKLASKLDATTTIDPHMTTDTEPTRLSENTRKQFASNMKKQGSSGRIAESQQSKNSSTQRVASESNESEVHPTRNKYLQQISPKGKIKKRTNKRIAELINMSVQKEQMEVTPSDPTSGGWPRNMKLRSRALNGHNDSVASSQQNYPSTRGSRKKDASQMEKNVALAEDRNDSAEATDNEHSATYGHDSSRKEESVDGNICRQEDYVRSWKVIEQGLLVKGLEIFGRNSCLIARNLLGGMKTCSDVFQYMNYTEISSASGVLSGVDSLANAYIEGHELRVRSQFFRRRGKVRRLKHTSKSAGYHVIRKRIAEKNGELYQQYNPCGCQSACGKECPCLKNETCCEKYCGCPKMCKNRFRGCHCARSQCRSRQCPCFAADRECDPDVCRNCWVGCGDGSLGFPNQRGDNYECRNMKVLLKQEQRILLGRSDVCGWGAFLKNTVGKDEYIGEYTGELISHTEAGRRGTIYDRENSSFLFNLNNEFVLDACRMGNKLKFANHSNDPNCYAKVMLVAGDHRVGIFAKERIGAGEEIFYDYNYKPDETPAWALKPDAPGAKDPGQSSCTRAKKLDAPGAKDPGQTPCKRGRKPGH